MDATQVKLKCISKKDSKNFYGDTANYPIATEIELEVPYDTASIYHKMSGGTNIVLRTVNQEAAKMFVIGNDYMMVISPVQGE